ncbi:superoxide dismutase family protein [Streptomyces sp. UNOB3_S3]|uniref:superoxide dismutase family protein n=1 Tax=Streptomyces sp. UNOB3_S3 TaxID=2871682 RepID=UPI001E462AFE|nr:superoxide dismutase family protein [Streptomyces sp. UNOB3_S3]MCC3774109.1 superoxide dismutase family protein [Streptomyces sp. UNOB3_S3]
MSFLVSAVAASLAVAAMPLSATPPTPRHGVDVYGQFEAAGGGTRRAVTFDKKGVPEKSRVAVLERKGKDGTRVELRVRGLQASRTYGAHVHTNPCGNAPDESGPHYQDVKDPKSPSVDPKYANPHNEAWLDLTTDKRGNGRSAATVKWHFRAGEARSVVIHEHATETAPGKAGTAGARLACLNVPFN